MITFIGTPPNIVIGESRNDIPGEPFRMFDFAPVGIACAAVGIAWVALVGWRLLPKDRQSVGTEENLSSWRITSRNSRCLRTPVPTGNALSAVHMEQADE